ncbi:winged helix-turn-helix transcriptional regulator [Streptomyces sp. NPDC002932]|uniref:winged helix-turn-helix transcriptional regulator n=1 Tax=Streptomyces sp. NPDC002932 TaxID=3364672 RepID=UPI00367D2190
MHGLLAAGVQVEDSQQSGDDPVGDLHARTVRHLERDGLVSRTAFPEVPPRVEYELTATGRTLIGPAVKLAEWAVDHNPGIERNQAAYDSRQP